MVAGGMSRPVLPIDPAGRNTHGIGPTNPGPRAQDAPLLEGLFPVHAELHVSPSSDVMNEPGTVAQMMLPSTSATLMVGAYDREVNVIADGWGLGTPWVTRIDSFIPAPNASMLTSPYQRRPNVGSGTPPGVKMSVLASRWAEFLKTVQGHLLGTP